VPSLDPPTDLRRSIGLGRATAMVVGIIIGASIFVQPSAITASVPSVPGVLAVWAAAGALTLIGALVVAELASAWPRTGGVYVFLREAWSPAAGFLWGWAMFWTMHTGIIAAIAMIFARYLGTFVPLDPMGTRMAAMAAVIGLSAVNYRGVGPGAAVQAGLTVVKVLAIVSIVAVAVVMGVATHPLASSVGAGAATAVAATVSTAAPVAVTAGAFFAALVAGLFAFGGWHMVSYAAEETVDPVRTIPRALVFGTLLVTALYVAVNAAYLHVLPLATVSGSTAVAADFADATIGGSGRELMSAVVVLSTLGAMNGVILAGPRVYLAMARDGLLFQWVAAVHPVHRTPHRAIVLQAVWACVLVGTGSYRVLFTRVVYTEWIFFGLMAASLFVLRRRAGYAPAYRMWGFPVLPAVFVLSTIAIVANQVATEPIESATGLLLVLSGLPVYLLWVRRAQSTNTSESAS
jgi:APA family basic amino acid/polyamine antiporter